MASKTRQYYFYIFIYLFNYLFIYLLFYLIYDLFIIVISYYNASFDSKPPD